MTAGKNPVTHVGKLYNVMANQVAQAIVKEMPEVEETYCYLVSRTGHPIGDPQIFELTPGWDRERTGHTD